MTTLTLRKITLKLNPPDPCVETTVHRKHEKYQQNSFVCRGLKTTINICCSNFVAKGCHHCMLLITNLTSKEKCRLSFLEIRSHLISRRMKSAFRIDVSVNKVQVILVQDYWDTTGHFDIMPSAAEGYCS